MTLYWSAFPLGEGGGGGGGSMTTFTVTTDTSMQNNVRYFCNGGAQIEMALPATASVGQSIIVDSRSAFGFLITQAAGQSIVFADGNTTTVGTGGSVESAEIGDTITLVCMVADTTWFCENTNSPNLLVT